MGRKKNKIAKITEEQYYAYIAGLRENAALFSADGETVVPTPFKREEDDKIQGD